MAASFALGALCAIVAPNLALSTIDPPPLDSAGADIEHLTRSARARPDVDCADFDNQAEAQAFMLAAGSGDPHRLDADKDGIACERLP
jgi:hypothetical protein